MEQAELLTVVDIVSDVKARADLGRKETMKFSISHFLGDLLRGSPARRLHTRCGPLPTVLTSLGGYYMRAVDLYCDSTLKEFN